MLTSLTSKLFLGYGALSLVAFGALGFIILTKDVTIADRNTAIARLERTVDNMELSSELAGEKAKAYRLEVENEYLRLAEEVQTNADQRIQKSRDAAERYIAANRVRCPAPAGDPRGGPGAGTQGDSAGNSEAAGRVPELDDLSELVAVTADDIRICTQNTEQAIAGRELALRLEAANN